MSHFSENCNPIVKTFTSNMFGDMRVVKLDGEVWFVAKDVCRALELGNVSQTLSTLDDDEKGITTTDTPGGPQEMLIINEPGLYSLILRSRKPEAKAFKRWICHEVLPSLRKHGVYIEPTAQPAKSLPHDDGFAGNEYSRVSYAKTLRDMSRIRGLSTDQRMIFLAKAACVLSGEPVQSFFPGVDSDLRERVLYQVDKNGTASTRDIYRNVNNCSVRMADKILQCLEAEGELIATTVPNPSGIGRPRKVWTRPSTENAH